MKKIFITIAVLAFTLLFCMKASATDEIRDNLSEKLFNETDGEITEILDDFGITSLDFEKIYNISFESIFSYYKDEFRVYLRDCINLFSKIFSIIILGGVVSLIIEEKKYKSILSAILIPVVTLILTDEINLCISSALSLIKLNGNFLLSFVPAYAITIALSGNPATAITYNTIVLGFAEVISAVINFGFADIIGCFFCLSIGFSLNENINFSRFISSVNRFISFALGLISSVFAAMLSVKGIFSVASDSVASKGIRFAIGSLIPVIGSSISDAYSTLIGSINILKSSVAIVGIVAVVLINLPVVFEILLFNISLNALSFISELFDCKGISDILKAFACGLKIIVLLVIFEAFILIISTAVMLTLRGG